MSTTTVVDEQTTRMRAAVAMPAVAMASGTTDSNADCFRHVARAGEPAADADLDHAEPMLRPEAEGAGPEDEHDGRNVAGAARECA